MSDQDPSEILSQKICRAHEIARRIANPMLRDMVSRHDAERMCVKAIMESWEEDAKIRAAEDEDASLREMSAASYLAHLEGR